MSAPKVSHAHSELKIFLPAYPAKACYDMVSVPHGSLSFGNIFNSSTFHAYTVIQQVAIVFLGGPALLQSPGFCLSV